MIVGIDPGTKRVGVAIADDETRFARPLEVIDVTRTDPVTRISEIVSREDARLVIVGRPLSLRGEAGRAVAAQRDFIARLNEALPIPVVEHDERLTTVVADQGLRAAGGRSKARGGLRDAVAAQLLLQSYLDGQR
ncbi:MAG: Holliday junction resolvase RuvX [Actinomycetota bacterium]|nr:Holliday junction resolvase RuvX [Actinomycetota bacterium]